MCNLMAGAAKPTDIKRLGIIVMMGFCFFGAATTTRLAHDFSGAAGRNAPLPSLTLLCCSEIGDQCAAPISNDGSKVAQSATKGKV